jgi:NADH-quinone oxidoreductase subunit C
MALNNMALDNNSIFELIHQKFGESVSNLGESYNMLNVEVNPIKIVDLIVWLQNHETLQFNFLTDICGVHYPDQTEREIAVVYHLHSFSNNVRIRIKAFLPEQNPEIPTLSSVFSAANWMERETYDFFGVRFQGHPDMRRILNVDHMEMFPLLKQYPLEDSSRTDKDDRFFGR